MPEKRIPGVIPIQATTTNLWTYGFCQWDPDQATLTAYSFVSTGMTVDLCTTTCASKGYTYAGLEWGNKCACGNSFSSGYPIDKSNCQWSVCLGSPSVSCGGSYAMSVYIV